MTPSHFFWFQDRCECGATFSADDNFCRMCGRRRQRPTTHTPPAHGAGDLAERQAAWVQWVTFGFVEMKHLMYRKYMEISYYHIFWCVTNLFQYGYNRPAHIAEYVFLKEQHIVESHCLYVVFIDIVIHISSTYFCISVTLKVHRPIRLKMVSKGQVELAEQFVVPSYR